MQAGPRFLSDAESRYAIIELELLAVTWAIHKCDLFLAGLPHFTVVTDHHPLISILNNHRLDEIVNPRLQRLKTRVLAYNFTAEWIKGALNNVPDALSRHPVSPPSSLEMFAERDTEDELAVSVADIRAITSEISQESVRLQDLRSHAMEDQTYQQLLHYIQDGFPQSRGQLPDGCKPFWGVRSHLSVDDGMIVYGCRLVIPHTMRQQVLKQLHESHQGVVRTKQRAGLTVYWPGMDHDIDDVILACTLCQRHLPSHSPEPILSKPRPTRPFQEIAADFCSYAGRDFLITVDCFTDWPDVTFMASNTTTPRLITALKQSFCRSAVPDIVWSDQGPQFTSKLFQDFAREWGFCHITSTPTYPQSNGKVEATVKSMKKLIEASWTGSCLNEGQLARALLQYRNTPSRRDNLSPAQKLFGHPIQDTLPAHRRSFAPEWQRSVEETDTAAASHLERSESDYNTHARELPELRTGSSVVVQNPSTKLWDIYGVIVDVGPYRRYYVKTMSGRVLVRNRRFLRRRVPLAPVATKPSSITTPPPPQSTEPLPTVTPPVRQAPTTLPNPTAARPPPRRAPPRHCGRPQYLIEEISFT